MNFKCFYFFWEMVGSVLGLKTDSKKSDVAAYFKTVQDTVQGAKDGLNKIVADMKKESNPNAAATETAVGKLVSETLDKIIEGAKTASEAIGDASELIGNVAAQNNGGAPGEVKSLIKGIKYIVGVVLKEGNAEAGDNKKAEDGSTARNNDGASKLFINGNVGAADAAKKSSSDGEKAVGAVTGADILQAMIKDDGNASKLAVNNAAQVAGVASPKDAELAGGIALRAMAKGGQFANATAVDADYTAAVKGVATSSVTKVLDTLTIAIRRAMDLGLKNVREAIKINANATPVVSDKSASDVKNQ
ncbi:hypothetical protein BCD_1820 (plasmid) [Borrelia crocidurae DOU]|uniref:Variable large protein n=1 Tax=Borrelia crocidurae DOU TaxID=1293575 RepID=W5SS90_9SPIR|nr:hypothetical protein BCD_1820 [Borrelia crocidurae DOU]